MKVFYIFSLLLFSSVYCLPAEYDGVGNFTSSLDQPANATLAQDNDTVSDGVKGGVDADSWDRQNVTSDVRDEEGHLDNDDGKVLQKTPARPNIEPEGTFSESYGELTNMSKSSIFTHSPHLIVEQENPTCKYPTTYKESEIECLFFPLKVVCIQTCAFGYTFGGKNGIQRSMECIRKENVWKPVPEFEKCKPFVDCGVTLGPGGSAQCRKHYMHKGPDCDIACTAYEDKKAVPTARYECDINGIWTPQLPFCAKGGSGIKLVPAPQGPKLLSDLK